MRHNKKKGMKLGTDASHTKAMKRSLVRALFENDRIKTIDVRAKAIRAEVDHVITWAATLTRSSPGPRRATSPAVVWPSPPWATRTSSARSSRRPPRACGPTVTAATPAS